MNVKPWVNEGKEEEDEENVYAEHTYPTFLVWTEEILVKQDKASVRGGDPGENIPEKGAHTHKTSKKKKRRQEDIRILAVDREIRKGKRREEKKKNTQDE